MSMRALVSYRYRILGARRPEARAAAPTRWPARAGARGAAASRPLSAPRAIARRASARCARSPLSTRAARARSGSASGGSTMFLNARSKVSVLDLLRGVVVHLSNLQSTPKHLSDSAKSFPFRRPRVNPCFPRVPVTPVAAIEGRQRPNLKSEDSGLRHRFSEAKVSLWMCENGTGHEESRGPTRR